MKDYTVKNWYGLLTRLKDDGIPKGYASSMLNWVVFPDRIELRRGMELMGVENTRLGKITGLKVGKKINGTEVLIRTRGQKIEYYDETNEIWVEILGKNGLGDKIGAFADGDEMSIQEYQSLAGSFFYLATPNGFVFKIPVATPSIVVDLSVTDHRGYIKVKKGATYLFNRKDTDGGSDTTGLYRSVIDRDELSDYSEITNDVIDTGDGVTTDFSGNLPTLGAKETCHYVRITDGTEIFTDDRNGNLVGDQGGTGTINYADGAYTLSFNTPVTNLQDITADYYIEDSTDSGIFDFSKSTPRQAGEGFVLRQDDGGGAFKNLGSIGGDEYCFHEKNIYKVTISDDDASASNIIYRNNVGIESWKSMIETDEGVYFIDSSNKADPVIRILRPGYNNPNAIPKSISDNLDLSGYDFSGGGIGKWGVYIVVYGKKIGDAVEDKAFFYHTVYKSWIETNYRISFLDSFNGVMVAGDSGSNNVLKLFSGITDDEADIENFYETGNDPMGKDDDNLGLERFHRFVIWGLIQKQQSYDIYFSYDNGKYVKVGTIDGSGDYVDISNKISVGNNTLGDQKVGGGELIASPYKATIKVHTPKFEDLKIKFIATNIGYVSIHGYECKDRRQKGRRVPAKYIQ